VRWFATLAFAGSLAGCDRVWGLFPLYESTAADASMTDGVIDGCPPAYSVTIPSNTSKYRVETAVTLGWTEAAEACRANQLTGSARHTHLLVVSNVLELDELANRIPAPERDVWVGSRDLDRDGVFTWVTNEPVPDYPPMQPPWDTDQPDKQGVGCADYRSTGSLSAALGDSTCEDAQGYICECDAYAPP
jgi:hypothetical protein